ncbi:MAG: hypothetical protein ACRD0C_11875 [Acidimicrobiia bacterium]
MTTTVKTVDRLLPRCVLAGLGAWVLVAGATTFPAADPAGASPAQGWAWEVQRGRTPNLGIAGGIPPGDLPVAWLGQPDKLAYLGLGVGAGSLTHATLELTVDQAAPNLRVETAELRACVIVTSWAPGEPMAWDARPRTACDGAAGGRYDASAGTVRFELAAMADALSGTGAQGLAIEPAKAPSGPFQVVFKGAEAVTVRPGEDSAPLVPEPEVGLPLEGGAAGAGGATEVSSLAPAAMPEPSDRPATAGPAASFALSEPVTVLPFSTESAYAAGPAGPTSVPAHAPALATQAKAPSPVTAPAAPGRPFGLTGVYAVLVVLATLPVGGRLLAPRTGEEGVR